MPLLFLEIIEKLKRNMKVKVNKPTIHDVTFLECVLDKETIQLENWLVNGEPPKRIDKLPLYVSHLDNITFYVDLHCGYVLDWPKGRTLEVEDKVRDEGEYFLTDAYLRRVIEANDPNPYVVKMLDTRGDGFGDYMQFEIDENGYIKNWKTDFRDFDVEPINS